MKLRKVWVTNLFGTYKGLILKNEGNQLEVELVGYPFGTHPNGKIIQVPSERISERE